MTETTCTTRSNTARSARKYGVHPVVLVLLCALAACSPAKEISAVSSPGQTIPAASQDAPQSDITPEKIVRDVIGRVVKITAADSGNPATEWTFDADEFKQVEILERESAPGASALTVFMSTHDNPAQGEDSVQVSGKLKLRYQRKGGEWVLTAIENLTFRYTVGRFI